MQRLPHPLISTWLFEQSFLDPFSYVVLRRLPEFFHDEGFGVTCTLSAASWTWEPRSEASLSSTALFAFRDTFLALEAVCLAALWPSSTRPLQIGHAMKPPFLAEFSSESAYLKSASDVKTTLAHREAL